MLPEFSPKRHKTSRLKKLWMSEAPRLALQSRHEGSQTLSFPGLGTSDGGAPGKYRVSIKNFSYFSW